MHLTIFEMLETLETEIVSLRTRNLELRASLSDSQSNGTPLVEKQRPQVAPERAPREKKRSGKTKQKPRPKAKKSAKKVQQLELAESADTSLENQSRTVGKRQALGRSLLQLRKMSPTRSQ